MIYLCILVHACSVWCCLVYFLFPVYPACESCLVLSCPALMSLLNIIIWVYILVRVFLFLTRVCTVTIPWHVHIKNRFQLGGGWLQSYSFWRIYDFVLYTVLCVTCLWRKIAIALDKTDPHGSTVLLKVFPTEWIFCARRALGPHALLDFSISTKSTSKSQKPQVDSLYLYGSHILILAGTLFSDRELLSELKDECDQ